MTSSDIFLGCFAFGLLWSIAAVLLGGFHTHGHGAHIHHAHAGHSHVAHAGHNHPIGKADTTSAGSWLEYFLNLHAIAIFLAWMGGAGYLMERHTGFGFFIVIGVAVLTGLAGGAVVIAFFRFLGRREFVMDAADYEMVGVLGRISCPITSGGTGEMIFTRDGARRLAYVRSESGAPIERHQDVVVTSYRGGIAYVRTWENLTGEDVEKL